MLSGQTEAFQVSLVRLQGSTRRAVLRRVRDDAWQIREISCASRPPLTPRSTSRKESHHRAATEGSKSR
jgi:hypothetical protein